MTDNDLICRFEYGTKAEDKPRLVIEFGERFTLSQIQELSDVLEKTATKWMNCKGCHHDGCDKSYGEPGSGTDHNPPLIQ